MIITVTMNPAIDKTVYVDKLCEGGLNRVKEAREDAGGKGINVSKTIRSLGGNSLATGFLGGMTGWKISSFLDTQHISHEFVQVSQTTRTNLKVVDEDGVVTEINEPGPEIEESECKALLSLLKKSLKVGDYLVISGSLPKGASASIYEELITLCHEKGAFAFVDADGDNLVRAVQSHPDIIKPNQNELESCIEKMGMSGIVEEMLSKVKRHELEVKANPGMKAEPEMKADSEMKADFEMKADSEMKKWETLVPVDLHRPLLMGALLVHEGIREVIVSLGKRGAFFISGKKSYYAMPPEVKALSTVGAGDALVGAYALGCEQGEPMENRIRRAIATSAGAVTTQGTSPANLETVAKLSAEVTSKMIAFETPVFYNKRDYD